MMGLRKKNLMMIMITMIYLHHLKIKVLMSLQYLSKIKSNKAKFTVNKRVRLPMKKRAYNKVE